MPLYLPSLKRLLTVSLCTVLCTAVMCSFTPSTHAWPKGGGGNGGGGNGGGDDPPPPEPDLPEYTIEFIGAFGNSSNPRINGMNDFGDLVGRFDPGLASPHNFHAFVYIDGAYVDLNSLLEPDTNVILREATDINNYGEIAGVGWRDSDGDGIEDQWANFRLTLDDGTGGIVFEELESLGPSIGVTVGAMNDSGDIVGEVETPQGRRGALWSSDNDGDGLIDLVDLGPDVSYRYAGGITNRRPDGTIQFTSVRHIGGSNIPTKWRWTGDLMGNGALEDLGGYGTAGGADINDLGDVVGSISLYEPGFRYTDDGGFEEIGPTRNETQRRRVVWRCCGWHQQLPGVRWLGIQGQDRRCE